MATDPAAASPDAKKRRLEGTADGTTATPAATTAPSPASRVPLYLSLVDQMRAWDTVAMFHEPVDEAELPDYRRAVPAPMDLATLRAQAAAGKYVSDDGFADDVFLIASNGMAYNACGTRYHKHAKKFEGFARNLLADAGIDVSDAFVPTDGGHDDERGLRRAERRAHEDLGATLAGMTEDLEVPIEVLRERYKRLAAVAKDDEDRDDDDDDDDDDEEEESSDDGTGSGSSEEGEEDSDANSSSETASSNGDSSPADQDASGQPVTKAA